MLGDSINFNKFNRNPVVLKKKIGKTSKNYHFWAKLAQIRCHYGPHRKQKTIFFIEITNSDHQLSKTFYFIKISYVLPSFVFAKKGNFQPLKAVAISGLWCQYF